MVSAAPFRPTPLVWLQTMGILVGFVLLMIFPPSSGRILLIALTPGAEARLVALAVDNGARLVARGPVPASLIVDGARARLGRPMLRAGIMMLRAPASACGGGEAGA